MQALTIVDVTRKIGAGRTFVYSAMSAGNFPQPIRVGRRSAWVDSEIEQWLADRIAERDAGATRVDAVSQRARGLAAARQGKAA